MKWIEAESREALAERLADDVAEILRAAISARGRAGVAVPGGTTPSAFLTALGGRALDWERVGATLTDERWVPVSSDRSNQKLLAGTLFAGQAAGAEFVPLYGATAEPSDALGSIGAALKQIVLPLDACVLGMGEDGHTASLFPGALGLEAALEGKEPVAAITAPGAEESRVTLTLPVLAASGWMGLLIHGAAKREVLERIVPDAPVARVLAANGRARVYWAA